MLKVDIIYSGNIYAPNGASVLMRKIYESRDLFKKYQIEQRVISPSIKRESDRNEGKTHPVKISWLGKMIRKVTKYSLLLSYLSCRKNFINPAKEAINQYNAISDKGEIVVFHELWTCYEFLRKYKRQGPKVILIRHGEGDLYVNIPLFDSILFSSYKKRMKNTILNGCYKIGFDADLPRKHFCEKYNYDSEKSFFVYNGIEARPCPQLKQLNKLVLICVATLSPRKNQMGILNAIGLLDKRNQQNIEVILVGGGPCRSELENKANGLAAKVSFTGSLKENQYYEMLLKSNCFCLFSKAEGLPIAILEAMRAGLPIIGSQVGGISEEIVDGKTGFVVDLNEQDLSEKLDWMINHLNSLPKMGAASYQLFVDYFTTEAMVKKYVEVYNS